MIRCIVMGNSTLVQGVYVREGVVRFGGRLWFGRMIPSVRSKP